MVVLVPFSFTTIIVPEAGSWHKTPGSLQAGQQAGNTMSGNCFTLKKNEIIETLVFSIKSILYNIKVCLEWMNNNSSDQSMKTNFNGSM